MSIETELQERIGRLQTAFAAANTAITGKGGTAADDISGLAIAIGSIPTGTPLPTLTNPAAAGDILSGKEAIDGQGAKLTGSLVIANTLSLAEDPTVTNGVLSVEVESSKETGTKTFTVSVPDALPENIVYGKTILGVTGTYEGGSGTPSTLNISTFTVASDVNDITLANPLGTIPHLAIIISGTGKRASENGVVSRYVIYNSDGTIKSENILSWGDSTTLYSTGSNRTSYASSSELYFGTPQYYTFSNKFVSGKTYTLILLEDTTNA